MDIEKEISELKLKTTLLAIANLLIIFSVIQLLLSWLTIQWNTIEVSPSEYTGINNGAVTYLLNIWKILQFLPTIAMIWGGFYIITKIFWLFNKN